MSGFGAPKAGAKTQMRPGGGFRQTFGSGFSDEHESAAALSSATAQKQTAQQSSVLGQQGVAKQQQTASNPRNIANLGEELILRPAKDIVNAFKSFFDLNAILGIKTEDPPEKKAKKQKIAQNWQKLTQEEQAYVQQKYQEEQQKKQQEMQEEQKRKEEEARQAEEQIIAPPSSPKKGPVGPSGNKKQQTAQLMQNKRTQMSQADG